MKLKWDDLSLFLAAAELGSLSAAARSLGIGQPTMSRRIGELEELLGEPLFERQSQGIALTAMGQKLLPSAQRMADWATEAELSVKRRERMPSGRVRVASSPGFAYELLVPLAVELRRANPKMSIDILSGVQVLNLGRGEADLALRNKAPSDPDQLCLDNISNPIRIYTSRSYRQTLPDGFKVDDLDWISWSRPYDNLPGVQHLKKNIPAFNPVFTSDDYLVQLAACRAGIGAMLLPKASHRFSQLGELEELPIELGSEAVSTLYLVCHKRQFQLQKVQVVIRAIGQEFSEMRAAGGGVASFS